MRAFHFLLSGETRDLWLRLHHTPGVGELRHKTPVPDVPPWARLMEAHLLLQSVTHEEAR